MTQAERIHQLTTANCIRTAALHAIQADIATIPPELTQRLGVEVDGLMVLGGTDVPYAYVDSPPMDKPEVHVRGFTEFILASGVPNSYRAIMLGGVLRAFTDSLGTKEVREIIRDEIIANRQTHKRDIAERNGVGVSSGLVSKDYELSDLELELDKMWHPRRPLALKAALFSTVAFGAIAAVRMNRRKKT